MTRQRWLIAAFSVLWLLEAGSSGAGDAKKDKEAKAPSYYPLEVGTKWEYDLTINGNVLQMNSKIVRTEKIDDVPLAVLEAEIGGKATATEHLRQTAKGLLRYRTNQFVADPPLILLPSPVKPGDKWGGAFMVGESKAKYAAQVQEETVEVPAGKFKTLRVAIVLEQDGKIINTTYWFAQNVGFVKQTVNAEGINLVIEMRKFEPKKN
jgi:hypothetical protein